MSKCGYIGMTKIAQNIFLTNKFTQSIVTALVFAWKAYFIIILPLASL